MSKIRLAEYHYRKAVEIHPNNAVLLGCVGMVSHGMLRAVFVKNFDPKPLLVRINWQSQSEESTCMSEPCRLKEEIVDSPGRVF